LGSVGPLNHFAPVLFAATSRTGKKRLLRDALHNNQWANDIAGAPTTQVMHDYLRVWEHLHSVVLQPLQPDRFVWKWSPNGGYSVSSTYRAFFTGSTKLLGAKELWQAKAPPKVKMFFWLALHRRLWTAERRKRHGLQDDDACALCDQHAETGSHLFLGCAFARQVWFGLLSPFQLVDLVPVDDQDLGTWWIRQRRRIDKTSRPLFDRLLLLIAWSLWKERNARVFARTPSAAHDVVAAITRDGKDWAAAGYAPMAVLEAIWSQNLVAM
jgi:hypothetical protein